MRMKEEEMDDKHFSGTTNSANAQYDQHNFN
jgi:hypothetical protein